MITIIRSAGAHIVLKFMSNRKTQQRTRKINVNKFGGANGRAAGGGRSNRLLQFDPSEPCIYTRPNTNIRLLPSAEPPPNNNNNDAKNGCTISFEWKWTLKTSHWRLDGWATEAAAPRVFVSFKHLYLCVFYMYIVRISLLNSKRSRMRSQSQRSKNTSST